MGISGSHRNSHSKQLPIHVHLATEKETSNFLMTLWLTRLLLSFHLLYSSLPIPGVKFQNPLLASHTAHLFLGFLEPMPPTPSSLSKYFPERVYWEETIFYLVTSVNFQEVCHLFLEHCHSCLFTYSTHCARYQNIVMTRTNTALAFVELTLEQGRQ